VKHTSGLIFLQFRSTRDGIDFEFYQEVCKWAEYAVNFPYTDDFDFPYVSFGINLDAPPDRPSIQKALVKCLPGVRSGGRFA
jgi:hypothetical protein